MSEQNKREKEINALKQKLLHSVDYCGQAGERSAEQRKLYSLNSGRGKKLYESFSDEELLQYLRTAAKKLNHAPAQKEIYWVMRDYIKVRFKRWPYALKRAGLAASAGKGGKTMQQMENDQQELNSLRLEVKRKALKIGKIPHPGDLPDLYEKIRRYYNNWGEFLESAELNSEFLNQEAVYLINNLEEEYKAMLTMVKDYALRLGRSPIHGEIDSKVKNALIERCGSWRNALYQIGLEPVKRIRPFRGTYLDYRRENNRANHSDSLHNCIYRVLSLTDEDREMLQQLQTLYKKTGIIPGKEDVPKELRQALQKSCGSWVNVLYQIGINPESYYVVMKGGKTGENQKTGRKQ